MRRFERVKTDWLWKAMQWTEGNPKLDLIVTDQTPPQPTELTLQDAEEFVRKGEWREVGRGMKPLVRRFVHRTGFSQCDYVEWVSGDPCL